MQAIPREIKNDDDLLQTEKAFDGAIADISDKVAFFAKFFYGESKIDLHIVDRLRDAMADMNQCLHIVKTAEDLMVKYIKSPEKSALLQPKLSEAIELHRKGEEHFKTIIAWIPQINTRRGDGRA